MDDHSVAADLFVPPHLSCVIAAGLPAAASAQWQRPPANQVSAVAAGVPAARRPHAKKVRIFFGNQDGTLVKPNPSLYITPFDDYGVIATNFIYGSRKKL